METESGAIPATLSGSDKGFADPSDLMRPEDEAGRFDHEYLGEAVAFGWAIWAVYMVVALTGILPVHDEVFAFSATWVLAMNLLALWVYLQHRPNPFYDRHYIFLDVFSAMAAIIAVGNLNYPVWLVLVVIMLAAAAEQTDTIARVICALCIVAYLVAAATVTTLGWSDTSPGIIAVTALILALISWNITLTFEGGRRLRRYIRHLSVTDPLTQIANRRSLAAFLGKTPEGGHSLAVAMLDVDRFKQYNDAFGHLAGDKLLVRIADMLKHAFPDAEMISRYGGDEFVIVTRADSADEVRACIESALKQREDESIRVSFGVALWPDEQPTLDSALSAADDRLRQVKRGRRAAVPESSMAS